MTVERYKINTVVKVDSQFVFDHHSPNFESNLDHNILFVKMQTNYFNDLLQARRFVLLNDVFKNLGLPLTAGGAVIGWVKGLSFISIEEVQTVYRGTNLNSITLRHNARDNVLDYLESH